MCNRGQKIVTGENVVVGFETVYSRVLDVSITPRVLTNQPAVPEKTTQWENQYLPNALLLLAHKELLTGQYLKPLYN